MFHRYMAPPGRHRVTQSGDPSRQPLRLRYLAAIGLAAALVATIATPASAQPVRPQANDGWIALTQRVCNSSANWQDNQRANGGSAWVYLGRTYDIQCQPRSAARASRATERFTPTPDSGWVHPTRVLSCSARDFGMHQLPGEAKRFHYGQDMRVGQGSALYAMGNGKVTRVGTNRGGFGLAVDITYDDGYRSVYAHMHSASVGTGQRVNAGQKVGTSGGALSDPYRLRGNARGAHLHLQVHRPGAAAMDPRTAASSHGLRLC